MRLVYMTKGNFICQSLSMSLKAYEITEKARKLQLGGNCTGPSTGNDFQKAFGGPRLTVGCEKSVSSPIS